MDTQNNNKGQPEGRLKQLHLGIEEENSQLDESVSEAQSTMEDLVLRDRLKIVEDELHQNRDELERVQGSLKKQSYELKSLDGKYKEQQQLFTRVKEELKDTKEQVEFLTKENEELRENNIGNL
jgi:chromosome segregation ATPase